VLKNIWRVLFAVAADRFDRAAFHRFGAQRDFFLGSRLLVNEGIATLVIAREKRRGGFSAKITVNALLIGKKLSRNVWFPFVCFVGHGAVNKSNRADSVK